MASTFPLEIYHHILDLIGDDEFPDLAREYYLQCSLVCHAWHRRCQPFAFRRMKFDSFTQLPALYAFRQFIVSAPHLAALIKEVDLQREPPPNYVALVEVFLCAVAKHLPALNTVIINMPLDYTLMYFHPRFRNSRHQLHTVTALELKRIPLHDTWQLDDLLMQFPNLLKLYMFSVSWEAKRLNGTSAQRPKMLKIIPAVPPIVQLEISLVGDEMKVCTSLSISDGIASSLHALVCIRGRVQSARIQLLATRRQ